jgi:cell pole-organizing protein PopZ
VRQFCLSGVVARGITVAGSVEGVDEVESGESEMTQPAKAQEPSMEEILASIRRIIADDEVKPADAIPAPAAAKQEIRRPAPVAAPVSPVPQAPARPAAAKPAAASESNSQDDIDAMFAGMDSTGSDSAENGATADVFELTEQMAVPETEPSSFRTIEPQNDLEFSETNLSQTSSASSFDERVRAAVEEEMSDPASRPLLSQSTASAVDSAFNALAQTVLSNNARTLEDLVKEMLRPMLKGWLDDNLPGLVEKIVRAEIERVSRGR